MKLRKKCDFEGKCKNKAYREVYRLGPKWGKKHGWSYLCRKHFEEEKKKRPKAFDMWCGVD